MYITFPLQHKINKKASASGPCLCQLKNAAASGDWKSPRRLKQEMREENGNLKGKEKIRVKRKLDGSRGSEVGPMHDRASGQIDRSNRC